MANQKAQARAALAAYMEQKATTVQKSKNMLIDLNKTLKRCCEITGQEADPDYVQAIMERCLDTSTLQYMLSLGINDMALYRNKAISYATMVLQSNTGSGRGAPMDLGRMEGQDQASTVDRGFNNAGQDEEGDELHAMSGKFYNFG